MAFSTEAVYRAVKASFDLGGVKDFQSHIIANLAVRNWIVASDYNIASPGAMHDVYSFACYPNSDFRALRIRTEAVFPRDFKDSDRISLAQKNYFRSSDACFCFIFLVPRPRKIFRTGGSHKNDLAYVRDELIKSAESIKGVHSPEQIAAVNRFIQESSKKNFSIEKLERILLLCVFHAFVTVTLATWTSIDSVGWFPDRDDMTTYCQSAWSGIAFLTWEALWREIAGTKTMPRTFIIDHRVSNDSGLYDALIRVPDFLAATLSRWNPASLGKRVVLTPPTNAKKKAMLRYIHLLKRWMPENDKIWICNLRFDEQGNPRAGRIVATKTRTALARRTSQGL